MNQGIKTIFNTAAGYYIKSQAGREFLARVMPQIKAGGECRSNYEKQGTHIPPFLIASIASQCNLHCAGCYARANGACNQNPVKADLSGAQWRDIFGQAAELGISFILLAGGEPFMRPDVIEAAAQNKDIIFPVFTNGTMIDGDCLSLIDENRNIIPVFSIEGDAKQTDERRGYGVYADIEKNMSQLNDKTILFGASITVTRENINTVSTEPFISDLRKKGCGLVFFVEYVPVDEGTDSLTLTHQDIQTLEHAVSSLKNKINDMIILSFPGDEAAMGGCLASGRGFFHINASGGAEPCPFSPYAKYNLKTCSILDVLKSDYFAELREIAGDAGAHTGGCTLFNRQGQVSALFASK